MNDTTLKKIICCMLAVWMSLICLILLFIPLLRVNGNMVSGYVNTSLLTSSFIFTSLKSISKTL